MERGMVYHAKRDGLPSMHEIDDKVHQNVKCRFTLGYVGIPPRILSTFLYV